MEPNSNYEKRNESILCLFDIDGTLTIPQCIIEKKTEDFLLEKLKKKCKIGLIGGSDLKKIARQMNGEEMLKHYDYVFVENGLLFYKNGVEISRMKISDQMGEEKLQKFINYVLKYLSTIELEVKRGTFVEFRTGMLNISPIGRSCSQSERDAFEQYDKRHNVRKTMIEALKKEFPDIGLIYSIGGQISFDVFPVGWDKTYCLKHLEKEKFDEIHFFGDKTFKGGNDYEIFNHEKVIGHTVTSPDDTIDILTKLFKL